MFISSYFTQKCDCQINNKVNEFAITISNEFAALKQIENNLTTKLKRSEEIRKCLQNELSNYKVSKRLTKF